MFVSNSTLTLKANMFESTKRTFFVVILLMSNFAFGQFEEAVALEQIDTVLFTSQRPSLLTDRIRFSNFQNTESFISLKHLDTTDFSVPDKKSFFETDAVQIGFVPLIFFTASAATWGSRNEIRELRNRYIPTFNNGYDDYLQYAPAAAVYGLKLSGVKGRNNIGRASISYATSAAIMAILVNSIKYTAKVERPDNSSNNSFPSGHTSNAFMNAAFLDKEYGFINPAYSIAGYSMSTFTAVGRELNNRHWVSDVLAGMGIGILSTELGYFIVDKFYKNDGDNEHTPHYRNPQAKPSFLSLKVGSANSISNLVGNFEIGVKSKAGIELGLEGAYYFSRNWGVGAEFSVASFPISTEDLVEYDPSLGAANAFIVTQSMGVLNLMAGPNYTYFLSDKWLLNAKLNAGIAIGASGKVSLALTEVDEDDNVIDNEIDLFTYKPKNAFKTTAGVAVTRMLTNQIGLSGYFDYSYSKPDFIYTAILYDDSDPDNPYPESSIENNDFSYWAIGAKVIAFF